MLSGGDFMAIVRTDIPITSALNDSYILQLIKTYPFARSELLTSTAFQRPIRTLVMGNGPRKVILSASHHANEWITSLVLLKFAEDLAEAIQRNDPDALALRDAATVYMVPMVDPDGVDLVVGAIEPGNIQYDLAERLARDYPTIPFPDGWKANLLGVDLNLNYPAKWLRAREIKFSQGFVSPGPRDYVGRAPLNQLETQALAGYTEYINPALVLALHAQGEEIYWTFDDIFVPGAEVLGQRMAEVSGYILATPPINSSFAGYKDWFIQQFRRPGYTIEVGRGENPLPLSQFESIYRAVAPLLRVAVLG